jgi:hypothetical protein
MQEKCAQYWPDDAFDLAFGSIRVRLRGTRQIADHGENVLSVLEVKQVCCQIYHILIRFYYDFNKISALQGDAT